MSSLKTFQTLKSNREFSYFYNKSNKRYVTSSIVFYKSGSGRKVGFTASKKVGNAVARNFAKRRLRAAFIKLSDRLEEGTYIFVAKKEILSLPFTTIEKDLFYALKKLNAIRAS